MVRSLVVSSIFFLTEVQAPVSQVERFAGFHPQGRHLPGQRHLEDVLHPQPTVLWRQAAPPTSGFYFGFGEHTCCVWGLSGVPGPALSIDLK